MPALIIDSFPDELHAKLQRSAATHHRTVTQETVHLLEQAMSAQELEVAPAKSYWASRRLLPEFEAALNAGAFRGGTDSSLTISEERDAR